MRSGMNIAFFGSSLVSSYWNGAATYYRGVIRELHARGHRVTFYEPDILDRQAHRDIDDPSWAQVVVYEPTEADLTRVLQQAHGADVVVKASGVGVFDELLERDVLSLRSEATSVVFWDVDAPATLQRIRDDPADPFRALIPHYDTILTYGGGPPVVSAYRDFGAADCIPIYNALDPETHFPVQPDTHFSGSLGFLGNRLPDREARVRRFFFDAAEQCGDHTFLLGGNGWHDAPDVPANVRTLGHVSTRDHNGFNCSMRMVLNINRDSMAAVGFSPPTRVFEAAGAGACLITDVWDGIDRFLIPDREVLVARDGDEVARYVRDIGVRRAQEIGARARARLLAEHTYRHRAAGLERVLAGDAIASAA